METFSNLIQGSMEFQYAIGLLAIFVGAFLLVSAINHFLIEPIRSRRQINQRLRANKREQEVRAQVFKAYKEVQDSVILGLFERLFGRGQGNGLQAQLLQANIYMAPNTFVILILSLTVLGFFLGTFMDSVLWSCGLAAALGVMPLIFMRWKKRRKTAKIEQYMPDAMELLARSLRAGHTLQGTLDLASQEIPAPLGTELRVTYEEQRLGLSTNQAFRRMGERVASRDLQYFVTAVLIQTETGGNLAEILENIGLIIRDRMKLKGKIKALTAEGRFSALVLTLLPVVTFFAILLLNRDYMMTLIREPEGIRMLTAGAISDLLGIIVMKKMITIKV